MEINTKHFLNILIQIKAYKDVIVLRDSINDGCIDILFAPKVGFLPKCINEISMKIDKIDVDLFEESNGQKIGKPMLVSLTLLKDSIKNTATCILEDEKANGIKISIDKDNPSHSLLAFILQGQEQLIQKLNDSNIFSRLIMEKMDYSYAVTECSKFVTDEKEREYMSVICFDFNKMDVEGTINIVSTDGRKMCLLKKSINKEQITISGEYIVFPEYLFMPSSDYGSVQLQFNKEINQLSIRTDNYTFTGLFEVAEGTFPYYTRVIPEINEGTQWFTLSAPSFRSSVDSIKNLMGEKHIIYIDASNPENIKISVGDRSTYLEVLGSASRPMFIDLSWDYLAPCLNDNIPFTKFYLNGSNQAIHTYETKTIKGVNLFSMKIFMPLDYLKKNNSEDKFRVPIF